MDELELRIERLVAGGDGIGRSADGLAVFVPQTAPGDRVRVRVESRKARYARASVVALLEPGPDRQEPVCPVFGRCGGCAWQHLRYPAQLASKAAILGDALRRIGGFPLAAAPRFTPSPAPLGYRGRTRVRVAAGRVGFRARRSHALCGVTHCPVLVPALDAALRELAASPPQRDGEYELAVGDASPRVTRLPARRGPRIGLRVGPDRIDVSPGGFSQANQLLLETLVRAVAGAAGTGALALDLFAGAGLFTLPLARRFSRVIAVESDAAAAADLVHNVETAGLVGVSVRRRRVEAVLGAGLPGLGAPDALVLDPPRSGLPRGVARDVARLSARRVVYLSCDPATLARDLRLLVDSGLTLRSVEGFDLFPQTPHVEALAVLDAGRLPQGSTSP